MTLLPKTSQALDCIMLVLGGLLGWLLHPIIWIVAGPFRWSAFLLATAAQESSYQRTIAGDNGGSVGMLQYAETTWPHLTDRDLTDRESPFLSGLYAAKFVALALATDWRWLQVAVPFWGFATLRHMWTHGYSVESADNIGDAWTEAKAEAHAWPAALLWRGIWLLPTLLLVPLLMVKLGKKR